MNIKKHKFISFLFTEAITVHRVSRENVLISCPIEETEERNPLTLKKIHVASNMKLIKCFLGFENEQRMFANQNVQNIFKFCQFNADEYAKMVESEQLPFTIKAQSMISNGTNRIKGDGLKILNPLAKLLKHDRGTSSSGHEKEDSIIFLSKNDLESMDASAHTNVLTDESIISEKMKAFQPNKKRWFKNLRSKNNSFTRLDMSSKKESIDRYQDMSKLIQERFGHTDDISRPNETTPPRPSSEIGYKNSLSDTDTLQKSFSLQDLEYKANTHPDILNTSNENHSHILLKNKTFISDKLFNEFHVKTKQNSKSSSSIHQLLHLGKSPRPEANKKCEERYPFEIHFERKDFPMFEPNERQDDCSLTVLDDLPYSSVRDSIIMQDQERSGTPKTPSENIYAEIFTQHHEKLQDQEIDIEVNRKENTENKAERIVPNFHRISEINNSTRIRISLFNDDPNQTFTAKI